MVRHRNTTAATLLASQGGKQISTLPFVDHYYKVDAVAAASTSLDATAKVTADTKLIVTHVVITACEADDAHVNETAMPRVLALTVYEAYAAMLEAAAEAVGTGPMAATATADERLYPCVVTAPGGIIARRIMALMDPEAEAVRCSLHYNGYYTSPGWRVTWWAISTRNGGA